MAEMSDKLSVRMTFVRMFQAQEIADIFFSTKSGTLFAIFSPSSYLLPAGAIN